MKIKKVSITKLCLFVYYAPVLYLAGRNKGSFLAKGG